MHPSIHPAHTPADIAAVRTLMREYVDYLRNHPTGSAHFCIGNFEQELASLESRYALPGTLLLAQLNGDPLGIVAIRELRPILPEPAGLALELKRLWVRPAGRGLGLGRRLIQAALDHARVQRAAAVYLDTVPAAMPEATSLYRALGFQQVSRYNTNNLDGVAWFRLPLRSPTEPAQVTRVQNPTK